MEERIRKELEKQGIDNQLAKITILESIIEIVGTEKVISLFNDKLKTDINNLDIAYLLDVIIR